ncbi:MAG: isopeptide-forming domain-containing fimbrial protein [Ruminococcus sp.]|nr:isopeptide-forming domain-containing fimbrial protein [Ruminococcus sp.]
MKKTSRTFKRFAAITSASLLAACMVAPMASFAETGKGTITVNDSATSSSIKAYQIFVADVTTEGENTTVTIKNWGDGINVIKLQSMINDDDTVVGKDAEDNDITFSDLFADATFSTSTDNGANVESAQSVAKVLSDNNSNSEFVEIFAKIAAQCIITGEGEADKGHAAVDNKISNLDWGYYVAVDTTAVDNGSGYTSKSLGILEVLSSTTTSIDVKRDYPQFDKLILDVNDSGAIQDDGWAEAADHDINDDVSFQLIATVPTNIDRYDTYQMIFHDDLQKDVFSFKSGTIKAYLNDVKDENLIESSLYNYEASTKEDDAQFTASGKKSDGTEDFTVTFEDIKKISGIKSGDKIIIQYDATLTDKANLGSAGNWNGAYLEYSNNPNVSGEGDTHEFGKSTVDYVVAYTYQTVIDKINGTSGQPLARAEFSLQKVSADGKTKIGDPIPYTLANDGATFVFKGLDDGTYVLKETKAPNPSYNPINDITFIITAGEVKTEGSEALEDLDVNYDDFSIKNVYTITETVVDEENGIVSVEAEESENNTGAIYGQISNVQGTELPSTGGIGTTVFYLGGGAMVAVAGIYLISKKRMKNTQE